MSDNTRNENSYRSILKGTTLFGGVQLFQIVVGLLRGKFVAMFLGPAGMGVSSLFTNSSNTIQRIASLGLNLAIVKEVAAGRDDDSALGAVMTAARRMLLLTALLGAVVCVLFSRQLSQFTFGDTSSSWQFVLLSVAVFFGIAGAGELSILQGLHDVRRLSRASIVGASVGLFIGVPLYYFFGTAGIVPAMTVLAFSTWCFYAVSVRRSRPVARVRFRRRLHGPLARRMLGIGFVLMASDAIGSGSSYMLAAFMRHVGGLEPVGLYQAASSMTGQYASLVFSAMALDYLPRLAKVASDSDGLRMAVNRQVEIVGLLVTPLILLLVLAVPLAVRVLLTGQFMVTVPLVRWLAMGVLLRALCYPMGYIAFAKDNRRLFFWLEGVYMNLQTLVINGVAFYMFGIIGLGYAVVADFTLCWLIYYIVNRRRYGYRLNAASARVLVYAVAVGAAGFAFSFAGNAAVAYSGMGAVTLLSAIYSGRRLLRKFRSDAACAGQ